MSHFGTSKTEIKHTPKEWLKIGSQIGQLVNKWSERNDLVAYVGEELSAPVPALYDPYSSEVEVNTKIAFGTTNPDLIGDLNERPMMFEFPKATGAILHEALHARFTQWDLAKSSKDLTPAQNEALHLLEESRIEGLGVLAFPKNRVFLKACAMEIVIGELDEEALSHLTTTRASAKLAGLVGSRIDAGVLDLADVKEVIDLVRTNLGDELYGKLRDLWRKAQQHSQHNNAEPMYPLAIEWDRLVEERADEMGEPKKPEGGGGFPMPKEMVKAIKEALENGADETGFQVVVEAGEQEQDERWEAEVKDKADESKRREKNSSEATKVFSKSSGEVATNTSASRLVETRKPKSAERVASVKVSQMLEKAKYRERDVTIRTSVLPQGRLRSRTLVQGQALKSKGITTPVEAWKHKTRKHTDEPTLSIGVMVDISGSMGGAMTPMGITAWVLANAGRRIQAKTAMVYYGSGVFPTLRIGEKLDEVKIYSAPDGTERFDQAFRALDGHLTLLDGKGARLLVVVSDGHYSGSEPAHAKKWVAECDKKGVAVLWLTFDSSGDFVERAYFGTSTSAHAVSLAGKDVEQSAILIGEAGAKALESIGRRNAY
jgi:hypothetical protein